MRVGKKKERGGKEVFLLLFITKSQKKKKVQNEAFRESDTRESNVFKKVRVPQK
jgi:hypothetical protein